MSAPDFTGFFTALGRPIVYHPRLARLLDSVKAAILLEQLMYWTPRAKDPNGWIYKRPDELEEETSLTYEEQRGAREILRNRQVLEELHARLEQRLYFRVNRKVLNDLWTVAAGAVGESPPTPLPGGNARGFVEVAVPERERTAARAAAWIDMLNSVAGTSYRPVPAHLRHVQARLAEGFTLEDATAAVRDLVKRWKGTESARFLRPQTVFGSKFAGYLQASKLAAKQVEPSAVATGRR